mgnify:CR=1 FL=1
MEENIRSKGKFTIVKKEKGSSLDNPELMNEIDYKRHEWMHREDEYYRFSREHETAYDLRKGEIYEFDWGMNVNAEFSGRHYGVVLRDSGPDNPLVLVCPLKTNHKTKVNFRSDYYVGKIEGLPRQVESVAVLNQTRSLDKMRLYTKHAIGGVGCSWKCNEKLDEDVSIIRLDNYKLNKILSGVTRITYGLDPFDSKKQSNSGNH